MSYHSKENVVWRILFTLVSVLSIIAGFWPISLMIILVGLLLYPWYWEALPSAVLINILYGGADKFFIRNPLFITIILLVILEFILKPNLRFYDEN
ncbi:MAG TPA: hypothetical protein VJJ22_04755 [Candidatus Paceibacterota bacterium]